MLNISLPQPVDETIRTLHTAGFEAFAVGGCVRDIIIGRKPRDWDITTNALPEEVQTLFPESFYENTFGTVGVKVAPFLPNGKENRDEDIIEITTYRTESDYEDKRHPKVITFTTSLEEDLARRDFTINAIALTLSSTSKIPAQNTTSVSQTPTFTLIDPFHGQKDIADKIIRAVGEPHARFGEDALRLMRAVRLYAELRTPTSHEKSSDTNTSIAPIGSSSDWSLEEKTLNAIRAYATDIRTISAERVRDELSKIILSSSPAEGIEMLRATNLLASVLPELTEGIDIGQNLHHIYTVYEHNLRALDTCPSPKLDVRLASLLHDVGKPRTKRGDGYRSTFYNHDHVGARIARTMLERLRFPTKIIEKVVLLVDNHLFYYNVGEVTATSVRRLIRRVGLENMRDLMDIRIADRLGSGTPKGKPYKLRHLEYMIEKVSKDPISVKMLAIHGQDLMRELAVSPGPKIGAILDCLLAEVIDAPEKNTREILITRSHELNQENLEQLRSRAKVVIEEKRQTDDASVKQKHWVE